MRLLYRHLHRNLTIKKAVFAETSATVELLLLILLTYRRRLFVTKKEAAAKIYKTKLKIFITLLTTILF